MPVSRKTRTTQNLPPPFIASEAQRLALAREQFFEEGVRPTGVVSEGVIQSWNRCLQAHRKPCERVEFDLVTRSRIHTAQTRNRTLLDIAAHDLGQLQAVVSGTRCQAVLTDATGVVLEVVRPASADSFLFSRAYRTGVNLSEDAVATTAPAWWRAQVSLASCVQASIFSSVCKICTAPPRPSTTPSANWWGF